MSEEKIIDICIGRRSGKTYNKIQEMAKEIDRLQKENEVIKEVIKENEVLSFDIDNKIKIIDRLQKENEELKEEILELKRQLELEKIDNKYNKEETREETIPRYIIQEKVEELDNMNVSGKLFTTAIKFAKSILEDLLKENNI